MNVRDAVQCIRDEMDRQSILMPHMNFNRTGFETELRNLLKRAARADELEGERNANS